MIILYIRLKVLLLATWSIYPLIWILSNEGFLPILDHDTEVGIYIVLDIFSKGFFGYFLLNDLSAINSAMNYKEKKLKI